MAKSFEYTATAVGGAGPESGALTFVTVRGASTPYVVATDSGLATPATNPAVADSDGRVGPLYFADDADITFTVKTSNRATTLLEVDYRDGFFSWRYIQTDQVSIGEIDLEGDGVTVTFDVPDVAISSPFNAIVSIDGALQPTSDYNVATDGTDTAITFATAPPDDAVVQVRTFALQALSSATASLAGLDASAASVLATGSTTPRTLAARAADFGNATDYGLVSGTGADQATALAAGLTARAGKTLRLPEGTIVVGSGASINMLTLSTANSAIKGAGIGQTVLAPNIATTSYRSLFSISGANVLLEDFTIDFTSITNGEVAVAAISVDGLTLRRIRIDGNITDNAGSASHTIYGLNFATANFKDITIDDCEFEAISFGILKANANTGNQRNVTVRNTNFKNVYNEACSPNSPNGSFEHFSFVNNYHENDDAAPQSATNIGVGIASCKYGFVGGGERFKGKFWECIHVEENSQHVVIDGVTGYVDCESFISLLDNNIGDGVTYYRPQSITIGAASAVKYGSAFATSYGINITFNGSGITSGTHINLGSGTLENFSYGMALACGPGDVVTCGSRILKNSTVGGIYMPVWADFDLTGCVVEGSAPAVVSGSGGIVRGLTVKGDDVFSLTQGALTFVNLSRTFEAQSIAGSSASTWIRLLESARRAKCKVYATVYSTAANYTMEPSDVSFDGSTAPTVTSENALDAGTFAAAIHLCSEAVSATVTAGGTGYVNGEIITTSGGTLQSGGAASTWIVTVIAGVVTAVTPVNRGQYTVAAIPGVAAATTGGSGTGCTLTGTYRNSLMLRVFNSGSTVDCNVAVSTVGHLTV